MINPLEFESFGQKNSLKKFRVWGVFRWALSGEHGIMCLQKQRGQTPEGVNHDNLQPLVESGEYSPLMADAAISHKMQEFMSDGLTADQAWNLTVEFMTLTIGGI